MSIFKDYERKVIQILVQRTTPGLQLHSLLDESELVSIEYTGVGYYLTVRHKVIPRERVVCSERMLFGCAEGIECGFVVFLENGDLTLECHSWGNDEIPRDFREKNVAVATAT